MSMNIRLCSQSVQFIKQTEILIFVIIAITIKNYFHCSFLSMFHLAALFFSYASVPRRARIYQNQQA